MTKKYHQVECTLYRRLPSPESLDYDSHIITRSNVKHLFCLRRIIRMVTGWPKSGFGYWLCPYCHPKNHAEHRTIQAAIDMGIDVNECKMLMKGHYHACKSCKAFAALHGVNIEIVKSK